MRVKKGHEKTSLLHATNFIKGMAAASQVSRSGWNHRRPHKHVLRVDRVFIFILMVSALLLSALSINYSRLLTKTKSTAFALRSNATLAAAVKPDETVSSVDSTGKYAKDRVYCMVPFIWNKEIYDISKFIATSYELGI